MRGMVTGVSEKGCEVAGSALAKVALMATDAPGVRSIMETVAEAKKRKLAIVAGFCWRYNLAERAGFEQIHNGAIGLNYEAPERPASLPEAYWSPDSRHLVAIRTRTAAGREVNWIESSPKDQLQPRLRPDANYAWAMTLWPWGFVRERRSSPRRECCCTQSCPSLVLPRTPVAIRFPR